MSEPGNHVTRVALAVWAATSQIFRCPGLQTVPRDADRLGLHDLAYWAIFLAVLAAWILFVFAPQTERLGLLEERSQVLRTHLKAEKRELARLQRSIKDLQQGDPQAWERAARGRLGWVEPGEITDLAHGLPPQRAGNNNEAARKTEPALRPPPVPSRPAIPPLLLPPAVLRPQDLVGGNPAGAELLGPLCSSPPPPPKQPEPPLMPLRLVQARSTQPVARNMPKTACMRLAHKQ